MKGTSIIWYWVIFILLSTTTAFSRAQGQNISFNFYGDSISFKIDTTALAAFDANSLSEKSVQEFYNKVSATDFTDAVKTLQDYKTSKKADDWLFYQLVRKTVQQISPKEANYLRYTLYKWYFMIAAGYEPLLAASGNKLLFYIQSDENIYNIPCRTKNGKQFICLNYHDYGSNIDFNTTRFTELNVQLPHNSQTFSYKIHKLPDFDKNDYVSKNLQFTLNDNEYHFKIKVNPQINKIFLNYPTVDYSDYFNMPLSKTTYSSLIPLLQKTLKGLKAKDGVDYLMRFTRYAFVYEPDTKQFGKEKRMTPEETLLYEGSDCEDRVFLFYYLVKEIYNLPMIALVYPQHVTIAVKFDKPVGKPIMYNGVAYSVCEPTPQSNDLGLGELLPELQHEKFEVVYVYNPLTD